MAFCVSASPTASYNYPVFSYLRKGLKKSDEIVHRISSTIKQKILTTNDYIINKHTAWCDRNRRKPTIQLLPNPWLIKQLSLLPKSSSMFSVSADIVPPTAVNDNYGVKRRYKLGLNLLGSSNKIEGLILKIFDSPAKWWCKYDFDSTTLQRATPYVLEKNSETTKNTNKVANQIIIYQPNKAPKICHFEDKNLVDKIMHVIVNGRPKTGFCCVDFVNFLYDKYVNTERTGTFHLNAWRWIPFHSFEDLEVGDVLLLKKTGEIKKKMPVHFAYYLGDHLFISLYGSDFLFVSSLEEMQAVYSNLNEVVILRNTSAKPL